MESRYSYIAFEGPLGVGTKLLAKQVANELNAELIPDLPENPFLEDFYKDKNGAAFQTQLFFLLNRIQLLENLKQRNLFQRVTISDFIIEKDRIYAFLNLNDSELTLYEQLYPMLTHGRARPDLVIYVQMSTEHILKNLKNRKVFKRFNMSPQYIDEVVEAYNRFFFHYDETPLIILNANEINLEKDRTALRDLLDYFKKDLRGATYFTPKII